MINSDFQTSDTLKRRGSSGELPGSGKLQGKKMEDTEPGVIGFDPTQVVLDSFPAQLKRLRTGRTKAFTSFNNAAVSGTTGAGGDATLLACEQ